VSCRATTEELFEEVGETRAAEMKLLARRAIRRAPRTAAACAGKALRLLIPIGAEFIVLFPLG
jgi:hypothetical protein